MGVLPENEKERKRTICLIVFSFLTLSAAISITVLINQLAVKIDNYAERKENEMYGGDYSYNSGRISHTPSVWYGSGFFISFLLAIISAFVNNRCMHIFSAVVSILVLIGNGLLFVGLIIIWSAYDKLNSEGKGCASTDDFSNVCQDIVSYGKGLTFVISMGWLFNLITCVLNFMLLSKPEPGAVIIHRGMTTTVMASYPAGTAYIAQPGPPPTTVIAHNTRMPVEGASGFTTMERPPAYNYEEHRQPRMTTYDKAKLTNYAV